MLKDGLYLIKPAFFLQPSPGIGADTDNSPGIPGAGLPVVPARLGWKVEHNEDDMYYLTLEEGWKSVEDGKQNVSVNPSIGELWHLAQRSQTRLLITQQNDITPKLAWTLSKGDEKTPVVLQTAEEPNAIQEWFFDGPLVQD